MNIQEESSAETNAAPEEWTTAGPQTWALQTSDGYVGQAHWRESGAGIAVTRPDGTDLLRRSWGSREIFLHSWPGMFQWLRGRVSQEITAERTRTSAETPAVVATEGAATPSA
jgi:hypothetical protein